MSGLPSHNKLAKMFKYLDALRESSITNMYGARPYLMRSFPLSEDAAGTVLSAWMKSFNNDDTPEARARAAAAREAGL